MSISFYIKDSQLNQHDFLLFERLLFPYRNIMRIFPRVYGEEKTWKLHDGGYISLAWLKDTILPV